MQLEKHKQVRLEYSADIALRKCTRAPSPALEHLIDRSKSSAEKARNTLVVLSGDLLPDWDVTRHSLAQYRFTVPASLK